MKKNVAVMKPDEILKWRALCAKADGHLLTCLPHFKGYLRYRYPDTFDQSESWKGPFMTQKKDQATQTYFAGEPCPLCLREDALRFRDVIEKPSVVDPACINQFTRDVAIECPDRTYYSSDQLTFIRVGQLVYRGWTYETPDGRIQHMPLVPRGIPIDELRVDPPLRAPAPR